MSSMKWNLAGPTRQSIIEHLNERVADQTDYQNNHCYSKYFRGIKLGAVALCQRAEADKGDEHLAVDHSLNRAADA